MEINSISQNIVSAIGSNTSVKPTVQDSTDSTTQSTKTDSAQTTSSAADTVQISSAAQAKATLQELTETHYQTSQEALKGDRQAKRLLAKEAAAKEPIEPKAKA